MLDTTTARRATLTLLVLVAFSAAQVSAQDQDTPWTPLERGSDNIEVVSHLPLGGAFSVTDMDMEQEMDRPYVYVSRGALGQSIERGTDIIDISDPENPEVIYEWRIENQELHTGPGAMDV